MNESESAERIRELELELIKLKSEKSSNLPSELLFKQAIEKSIPSGIAVFDHVGRQVYVNESFCKLVGWEESELLDEFAPYKYWYKNETETIDPDFQLTFLKNAPDEKLELVFSHQSGKLIPVQVMISPFTDDNNQKFWLANVFDITDQKLAEEALNKSQEKLPLLIKNSSDILLLIDESGEQFFISDAARSITGYTPDELKGPISNVIYPDDLDIVLQAWTKAFANKEPIVRLQYRHKHKEKNYVWVEAVAQNFLEHPAIKAVVVNVRDISENKEIEQKLKESETKFKEIIQQINDGIVVYDEQGKIVIWNQGAEKILGLRAVEALGRDIADVQHQLASYRIKDKVFLETLVKRILSMESPELFNQITDHEIKIKNSGEIRNIQSTLFPIKFNGYNLFCSVHRDTTEIKEYENRLLQINTDTERFLSILAHDLRSPFHALLGFLDVMTSNIHDYDIYRVEKHLQIVRNSASRIFNLLESMLLWASSKSKNLPYEPQKLDFLNVCGDVIETIKLSANNKDIRINHFAEGNISVFADIDLFQTVLRNLITNAVKFTHKGGRINIYAEQSPAFVTITVSDNGTGIEANKTDQLFDISKISSTLGTGNETGTGLGLVICRELVEKHGGQIWVESVYGSGSDFKFSLPVPNFKSIQE